MTVPASETVGSASPFTSGAASARRVQRLRADGLYASHEGDGLPSWRVSAEPFWLTPDDAAFLEHLGSVLLAFYQSLNRLYVHSLKTPSLRWVADYLDQGKPPSVVEYGRMRRVRDQVPLIIRPDLFVTDHGWVASELDAVPGGFGVTAAFQSLYAEAGPLVGGADGITRELAAAFGRHARVAIVVSDESADYRPEMRFMARALEASGLWARAVSPSEVVFHEDGLFVDAPTGSERIDVLYRFFELFDLKNVPKSELFLYAAKKGTVRFTPPAKAFLEEKLAMALWHHPALRRWWRDDVGAQTAEVLTALFPATWILDPSPVPPHAAIAGFTLGGRPVRHWLDLADATQRERRFVIKPSGFSALAWGGRGVVVGHDEPATAWRRAIETALDAFPATPSVLQEFHVARRDEVSFFDEATGTIRPMGGRTRLSPYYVVSGEEARLGGVLATTCGLDKKILHGMRDAVLAPCAVRPLPLTRGELP
ncbi:MAG: hypothetical protein ACOYXR_01840 [Nitrospirota bacterium]